MTNFNRKGFSLPELLAVMAIMAVLAATSSPFIRRYIRDAGNDKAKVILNMTAQGYKNFKSEYPRADFVKTTSVNSATASCPDFDKKSTSLNPGILMGCRYLHNITWSAYKYDFFLGNACCSQASTAGAIACMKGKGSAPYDSNYCAWVTLYGETGEYPIPSTL